MPDSIGTQLHDIFKELNIEVFFSKELDNDDTLSIYANLDDAYILS